MLDATVAMSGYNENGRLALRVGSRDHVQGVIDTLVTLVEYGDYQSSDCRDTYHVIQAIQTQLSDSQETSDCLCYVFRHFPQHPQAHKAAEAAEAAHAQGKFWQMHHKLFERSPPLSDADLVQCAIEIEIDVMQFLRDLSNHCHAKRIHEDVQSGVQIGVQHVPSLFINGVQCSRSDAIERLQAAIQAAPHIDNYRSR